MKKIILGIYFLFILIICILYLLLNFSSNNMSEEIIQRTINVDIKGAVKNPGVKTIEYGKNVNELINDSGGLLENADTSTINLSKVLENEDVVIIYTRDEIESMKEENNHIKIIDKECICPVLTNDVCIDKNFISIDDLSNKISLNSASREELMTLKGIGEAKADAIIEYRKNNLFNTIEDIMKIKGIGQSIFDKIKDNITV